MGSCMSSPSHPPSSQTAKIILPNGNLLEFSVAVTVQQVLETNPACFLCDSASMCHDDAIPAMSPHDELQVGQIYFVLPVIRLKQPLSASDMTALAVKANAALSKRNRKKKKCGGRLGSVRVAPVCDLPVRVCSDGFRPGDGGELGKMEVRKSVWVRRFHRDDSIRGRVTCRRFRLRLSTIYEELAVD